MEINALNLKFEKLEGTSENLSWTPNLKKTKIFNRIRQYVENGKIFPFTSSPTGINI